MSEAKPLYTEQGRQLFAVNGWTTSDLVAFGNFVLERFKKEIEETTFEEAIHKAVVYHADVQNFIQ